MIIAEVGQNFCGSMDLAKQLIILAQFNGADLVKFQLYDHRQLYGDNPVIPNAELSFDQAKMLFDYGEQIGMEVFFSVFDVERVDWCEEIGVKRYKFAARMRDNNVIDKVVSIGKPIIMSFTGERPHIPLSIQEAMCSKMTLRDHSWITFLYCPGGYPAVWEDLHFGKIDLGHWGGFSDHTIGIVAAKIAIAKGARVVEKHFAVDHTTGVDAPWSMLTEDLWELKRWEGIYKKAL